MSAGNGSRKVPVLQNSLGSKNALNNALDLLKQANRNLSVLSRRSDELISLVKDGKELYKDSFTIYDITRKMYEDLKQLHNEMTKQNISKNDELYVQVTEMLKNYRKMYQSSLKEFLKYREKYKKIIEKMSIHKDIINTMKGGPKGGSRKSRRQHRRRHTTQKRK